MKNKIQEQTKSNGTSRAYMHTTIALQKETKKRLDNVRAPGQCYDGFIRELVDYWERYRIGSSLCGPGKPVRQDIGKTL